MEDGFLALVDQAVAAGWNRAEVIAAIINLANNTALGDAARDDMERRLR